MEHTSSTATQPRAVDAGRGASWWGEAWALFTKTPGMWVVLALILFVVIALLSAVPVIGAIAVPVLLPVFVGGWMRASRKVDTGGSLEVGDLFTGFNDKGKPLAVVGALLLAAMLVGAALVGMLGFGAAAGLMMGGGPHWSGRDMAAAMGAGMLGMLLMTALGMLLAMAFWFAPALVVFRDVPPLDAMKASFSASLKNIVAFLLYGLIYVVAAILASIPFGLGWIVLIPVVMLSAYTSYRDVFETP